MCASGVRGELFHDHRQRRRCILDPADQTTQCPRIAQPHFGDDVAYVVKIKRQDESAQLPPDGTMMIKASLWSMCSGATPERSSAAAMA